LREHLAATPFKRLVAAVLLREETLGKKSATTARFDRLNRAPAKIAAKADEDTLAFVRAVFVLLKKDLSISSQCLYHGIPLWFTPYIERRISTSQWTSARAATFFKNLDTRPPVWVRINFPYNVSQVITELKKLGYSAARVKNALALRGTRSIYETRHFAQGVCEVQDFSSQLTGGLVKPDNDALIWDACAGNGGKTLLFASLLENKGAVYASDQKESRLAQVRKRARRAGFTNIRTFMWDGRSMPAFHREITKRGGFDWVFIDAPCSASGTWRKNPDAKLRFHTAEIETLNALKLAILENAAAACRAGGRLVYATCSLFVEENEEIVDRFLSRAHQFTLLSQTLLGSPELDCDTAFAAVFQKKAM
jgi:16S rRNA (cytosine967-C5)-methyltransferase